MPGFELTPTWAQAPRLERFRDGEGFMTGTPQTVKELTITSEHKVAGALLVRLEYRRDSSNREFFARRQGISRSQQTLTLGLVYGFASRL